MNGGEWFAIAIFTLIAAWDVASDWVNRKGK